MSDATSHRRRVLFVDDDPQFLQHVTELMTAMSGGAWDILAAESAGQAFTLLQAQTVELAVVDVEMGVMDGVQFLSLLNRGHPHVQKVVLTGVPSEAYRTACLANGAELFLEKPTTPEGWQQVYIALTELLRFHREEGFRGVLRRVGLQDVLQMECLARNSSVLEIADGFVRGEIYVEEGRIIHAQVGALQGEEAFNRLLALQGGRFNLQTFSEPAARTISGQWEFLLMEAARKRDEAEVNESPPSVPDLSEQLMPAQAKVETLLAITEAADKPMPAAETIERERPKITELLVCSSRGEVLHEWQCKDRSTWVNFFEFLSQKAQRLARGLALGEFDRLELEAAQTRSVIIITGDTGALVTAEAPSPERPPATPLAAPTGIAAALTDWMRQSPLIEGEWLRALRFADQTFVCDHDSREFPLSATAQSWRCVADTFDVLAARRIRPERMIWEYRQALLHCARRPDGAIFGVFTTCSEHDDHRDAAHALLDEFRLLRLGSPGATEFVSRT